MRHKIIILTILSLFLTGCGQLGASISDTSIISDIKTKQQNELKNNGKYKHIPLQKKGNYEARTDEYLTPDGKNGYWTTIYEERADGRYMKVDGEGILTDEFKTDWKKIKDYTNATTTNEKNN